MHGSHHGVVERLGHRVSSKAMASGGRLVSENRQVTRRRLQAGELQLTVERGACVRVGRLRGFITAREDVADLRSAHAKGRSGSVERATPGAAGGPGPEG